MSALFKKVFTKKRPSEESPIWLTVFCDMTTNLMLFFLLLYGVTRLSVDKQQEMFEALKSSSNQQARVRYKADRVLKEFHEEETLQAMEGLARVGGDAVDIKVDKDKIRLSLNNPVLFKSGESELRSKENISLIASMLKNLENKVIIEGHTDNIPISSRDYKSNWELSVARSASVIEYLIEEYKLAPARFIAAGYGEYMPVKPNTSPENRAANRRIEIVVLRRQK